jgi:hypothetical protein
MSHDGIVIDDQNALHHRLPCLEDISCAMTLIDALSECPDKDAIGTGCRN